MNLAPVEWVWQDAREPLTLAELSRGCGLATHDLQELVEYSALVPLPPATLPPRFSTEWLTPLRTVAKLRSDFDLELRTVALLLAHLNRIETLERQGKSLSIHQKS